MRTARYAEFTFKCYTFGFQPEHSGLHASTAYQPVEPEQLHGQFLCTPFRAVITTTRTEGFYSWYPGTSKPAAWVRWLERGSATVALLKESDQNHYRGFKPLNGAKMKRPTDGVSVEAKARYLRGAMPSFLSLPPALASREADITVQSMNYREYINSDQWRAKRMQYLRWRFGYKARWHCENCPSQEPIEVHHKTYEHLGDEQMIELIALCRSCHSIAHESGSVKFEFHTYSTRAEAKEKIQRSKEGIIRKRMKKLRHQDYAERRAILKRHAAKAYLWNTPNRPTGGFIEYQGRLIYDLKTP